MAGHFGREKIPYFEQTAHFDPLRPFTLSGKNGFWYFILKKKLMIDNNKQAKYSGPKVQEFFEFSLF